MFYDVGMTRAIGLSVFCTVLTFCAIPVRAQKEPHLIWEPPIFELPSQFPKPTKPKPIITGLKVAGISIQLEDTHLDAASKSLRAQEGSRGDAGEALGWICLYGRDHKGTWGLWLMSGEIDGPAIGSFQWQMFPSDTKFDSRCRFLGNSENTVDLAVDFRLGMTESQVEAVIGTPTSKFRNVRIYSHEHSLRLNSESYSADNDVFIRYESGAVSAMLVHYAVSS